MTYGSMDTHMHVVWKGANRNEHRSPMTCDIQQCMCPWTTRWIPEANDTCQPSY